MGTGVGEAMLIGAAVGAGTGAVGSAIQGGDVMQGALMGGATGAIGGGIGGAFPSAGSTAFSATEPVVSGAASGATTGATTGATSPGIAGLVGESYAVGAGTGYGAPGVINPSVLPQPTYTPGFSALDVGGVYPGGGVAPQALPSTVTQTMTPTTNVFGQTLGDKGVLSNTQLATIGGGSFLGSAMQAERNKYGVPDSEPYTGGPLSRFRYDPATYRPDVVTPPNPVYKPVYAADGGIMGLLDKPSYPQANIDGTQYATPSQMPTSAEVVASDYDAKVSPYTGQMMAKGGVANLGGYSDGGRMLKGPGDGMSDSIPGVIGNRQPARLADGEFVVPADVVSHLGNGSTDAGAKHLYSMMDKVRKARTGKKSQGKQINPSRYMPA